jgi:WD40 repeat protein
MKNNDLSWSPTFPTSILLASEDHNLYTFDIRRLSTPTQIYKAHVSAVTSCDWSPTGTEFVSGGWDRTLRIWQEGHGTHPEVYHTKRMQRVLATAFTADARFVLSGSDDGNVRVWKANASEKLGIVTARERSAIEYRNALKDRWKMDAEIGKVQRYAHSCLIDSAVLLYILSANMIDDIGVGIYRNPCTRLGSLNRRWKRQSASRRSGAGGIRARARANPRRNGRKWSLRNRANILYYRCVVTFPHTCMTRSVSRLSMT